MGIGLYGYWSVWVLVCVGRSVWVLACVGIGLCGYWSVWVFFRKISSFTSPDSFLTRSVHILGRQLIRAVAMASCSRCSMKRLAVMGTLATHSCAKFLLVYCVSECEVSCVQNKVHDVFYFQSRPVC